MAIRRYSRVKHVNVRLSSWSEEVEVLQRVNTRLPSRVFRLCPVAIRRMLRVKTYKSRLTSWVFSALPSGHQTELMYMSKHGMVGVCFCCYRWTTTIVRTNANVSWTETQRENPSCTGINQNNGFKNTTKNRTTPKNFQSVGKNKTWHKANIAAIWDLMHVSCPCSLNYSPCLWLSVALPEVGRPF